MDYKKFQIPKLVIQDQSLKRFPEDILNEIHHNEGDSLFQIRHLGEFIYKEPEMDVYGNVKGET